MDQVFVVVAILAAGVGIAAAILLTRRNGQADAATAQRLAELASNQQQLTGKLDQITGAQVAAQTSVLRTLEERLEAVSVRLNESLAHGTKTTTDTLGVLTTRLSLIDAAQKNIAELSGQVVSLQNLLGSKQGQGAFGETQLEMLVSDALPPGAYELQSTLSTRVRVDCLIKLPNPPGSICVDAKFPVESFRALGAAANPAEREQAMRLFRRAVEKHIDDIAGKYIVDGETADSALMFLPSEAIYAELQVNFADVVQRSYRARVFIVSPTTMWATLTTMRAVLRDAEMRKQAGLIQREVAKLAEDVRRLDDRVKGLKTHFGQAAKDIELIETSTKKIAGHGERIANVSLEDDPQVPAKERVPLRVVAGDADEAS